MWDTSKFYLTHLARIDNAAETIGVGEGQMSPLDVKALEGY